MSLVRSHVRVVGVACLFRYNFENHLACSAEYEQGDDGIVYDDSVVCGGNLFDHFMLHVNYGVINPLVFHDNEDAMSSPEASVFGFFYYFLINLVITAIVSGIIIDTFAEMRANRQAVAADLHTSCFICAIEREDFEQFGVRFQDHISDDHNMWK